MMDQQFRKLTTKEQMTRYAALAIGLLFLLAGICRKETEQVLHRAIQICLGCIGLE